jgi:hypothetical protein
MRLGPGNAEIVHVKYWNGMRDVQPPLRRSVRTHGHCEGTWRPELSKVLHSSGYTFMRSRPIDAMDVTSTSPRSRGNRESGFRGPLMRQEFRMEILTPEMTES